MEESYECQELKNLKYKAMLLNGPLPQDIKTPSYSNLSNLDKFLENEKNTNSNEPWCKLNKTIKTKKLLDYVAIYKEENSLSEQESEHLFSFLKECIDRKKLQRVKDVIYDKDTGIIKKIPALCYIKTTKHFTLKNVDKRISTLKSLPTKKTHGTAKKQYKSDSEDDDEN